MSRSSLAGQYDGGQMEMAAGLDLRPDGRFDYALSYGALDEGASGVWRVDGGRVLLTSDPVTVPRFVLLQNRPATDGKMRILLDLPERWSRQVFHAEIGLEDGRVVERQLSDDDDVIALEPGENPVSVRVGMAVFDLRSDEVRLAGGPASQIRLRFEPNDLGKVVFANTPLRIDGRNLILDRFDRAIVFRRIDAKGR
ncbi:MAG: hypothetical protein V4459_12375 [Pseudomonadota bacterium]